TATDSQITAGTGSWGLYMVAGSAAQLTNTNVTAGIDSYGALVEGGASLTIDGTSVLSAAGSGSTGISNEASSVVFGAGTPTVIGGEFGLQGTAAASFALQAGSTLGVTATEGAAIGVQLDASTFTGAAGSALTVAMNGATGVGVAVTNAGALTQAGSVAITGPGTAVSVMGTGSAVSLSGGGSASTAAGSGSAASPTVFVDDAAVFSASNLNISSAGALDAPGLLVRNGAQATLAGGSITTVGTGSPAAAASLGGALTLGPGTTIGTSGASSPGLEATGGTLNATDTTVTATGAQAPAVLLDGTGALVQFNGGSLTNAGSGTLFVTGTGAIGNFSDTRVGGSGEWLTVAPASAAAAEGTLNITRSTVTGSAQTAAGSTSRVNLIDSTWFLTGSSVLTSLVNDPSLIDFAPPVGPPDQLASYKPLTVNSYAGDGTLAMNSWLAADDSPSDRLVIVDGTGSGPGTIQVRGTGGGGALTTADGILLVQAVNSTTAANSFALAGPVVAGPYEYFLYQGGAGGAGTADVQNSWFLRSTIDCAAPGAPVPPCPSPPPPPPPPPTPPPPPPPPTPPPPTPPPPPPPPTPPPTPAFRQEVSLAAALPTMAGLYGRALVDTLHERVGDEHLLQQRDDLDASRTGMNGAWVRVLHHDGERDGGSQGIYGDRGPGFDYQFDALQIGLDLYRSIGDDGNRQHAGGYLAYGRGDGDVRHNWLDYDFHAGSDEFQARTIGAYWTGFNARGAYLDAVAQYTWYDLRAQSTRLPDTFTNGDGVVVSLEGGWPFALGASASTADSTGWRLEPQAQVLWERVEIDDMVDALTRVRYSDGDSTVGRLGVRLNRVGAGQGRNGGARASDWWLRGNVWHAFNGSPTTQFSSASGYVPFTAELDDTWAEVGIGGTWQVSQTGYLFADIDYTWSFDGDETAWNGKLGMRWNW
ncbi:MAG TPA: autotransporter outer membrane beta-barrel domain-containing protein, partial [Stenotrophomonas sp.]